MDDTAEHQVRSTTAGSTSITDGETLTGWEPLNVAESAVTRHDGRDGARENTRVVADLAVAAGAGVVVVVSAVLLARLIAPVRFTFDEWMFIADRHHFSIDNVVAIAQRPRFDAARAGLHAGFHTAGLHDQWFYRLALIGTHLALCGALAARVWRRHGPVAAAAVWVLVCFMGAGATNTVWPFQIGLVGSALFFVLAADALDRLRQSGRTRDAIWLGVDSDRQRPGHRSPAVDQV